MIKRVDDGWLLLESECMIVTYGMKVMSFECRKRRKPKTEIKNKWMDGTVNSVKASTNRFPFSILTRAMCVDIHFLTDSLESGGICNVCP